MYCVWRVPHPNHIGRAFFASICRPPTPSPVLHPEGHLQTPFVLSYIHTYIRNWLMVILCKRLNPRLKEDTPWQNVWNKHRWHMKAEYCGKSDQRTISHQPYWFTTASIQKVFMSLHVLQLLLTKHFQRPRGLVPLLPRTLKSFMKFHRKSYCILFILYCTQTPLQ